MKIQTNQQMSKEALALAVTPGVVGYTAEQVAELRNSNNVPARIRAIKSDALFALSADVVNTVRTGESAIAAQSVLLAKVLENNLFMTEGYKTFKEFAQAVYGINGAAAYSRAKVGQTIISNNKIPAEIRRMPVSTLERMASLSEEQILKAIDSGKITADMGQFEVRDVVRTIKSESGTTKPQRTSTTYPINVECFVNGEWSLLDSCKSLKSPFNAKEIANELPVSDWSGSYVKHPGEFDKSEIHIIAERQDGVWYHLRITKVVTNKGGDKAAKTLVPITAAQYAELVMKVGTGEIKPSELQNFTIIVEE